MNFDRRRFLGVMAAGAGALTLGACGGSNSDPLAGGSASPAGGSSGSAAAGSIVVGSGNFTESAILGQIYSQALIAKGVQSSVKANLNSREVYIKALQDGSVSAFPEYTGNLLLYFDKNATAKTSEEVIAALPKAIGSLKVLDASQAVDQDVYCCTQEWSQKNGVTSLADLSKVQNLSVGGPPELQQRDYGPPGLKSVYGATTASFKAYSSTAVKVKDLQDGKVDIADFFTTESAIADNNLVKLADPKTLILPQQVIPLVSSAVASNSTATAALNAVQKALTTDDLLALNKKVDSDRQDPADVAKAWLQSKQLV